MDRHPLRCGTVPEQGKKIWESICVVAGTTQGPWHLEGNKFMPVRRRSNRLVDDGMEWKIQR